MKKIAIAALMLLPASATAATLRQYTPGGAPCAGACTYEWAVEQFKVPEGKPERMVIPEGTVVVKMSYAKKGVAYAMDDSAVLAEDEPGEGYFFDRHNIRYLMVKLDKCQNWAVMVVAGSDVGFIPYPDAAPIASIIHGSTETFGSVFTDVIYKPNTPHTLPPVVGPPTPVPPPPPSPVPLPGSILALLAALLGLAAIRYVSNKGISI